MDLYTRIKRYYNLSYLEADINQYISSALRLHRYSKFSLVNLEYINIRNMGKPEAKKIVLEREEYYLDLLSPQYLLKLAGTSLGFKHSPKVIIRFYYIYKGLISAWSVVLEIVIYYLRRYILIKIYNPLIPFKY